MALGSIAQWSIVALADDVQPEEIPRIKAAIIDALHGAGIRQPGENQPVIRDFPLLRLLAVSISPTELHAAVPVGTNRIIAMDHERISRAIPDIAGRRRSLWQRLSRSKDPLRATRVLKSPYNGSQQHIVVLDTGILADHPDFKDRVPPMVVKKFTNLDPALTPAHGTRSVGLAAGPLKPSDGGARYSVAYEAYVTFGCVLTPTGVPDIALIDGIEYAVQVGATVVNLSVGQPVAQGDTYNTTFEIAAQRAMQAGVLIVAAAGNDESAATIPVFHPANCPSVMAVSALNGSMGPFTESATGVNCDGEVDIAAPGYAIRSSTDAPKYYDQQSGTSPASAIVSGIAALWAEKTGYSGCKLWNVLIDNAGPVKHGSRRRTGVGIARAPL